MLVKTRVTQNTPGSAKVATPASVSLPALPPNADPIIDNVGPNITKAEHHGEQPFFYIPEITTDEQANIVSLGPDALQLHVNASYSCRKIYMLAIFNPAAVSCYARCEVVLYRNNSRLRALPLEVGQGNNAKTILSAFQFNVAPMPQSLVVTLSNPQAWVANPYYVMPYDVECNIDRIGINVLELNNISNLRLWAACHSAYKYSSKPSSVVKP